MNITKTIRREFIVMISEHQEKNRTHAGVDINFYNAGDGGKVAPIVATHDGIITKVTTIDSGDMDGGGNRIQITSSDGVVTTNYMHLDAISPNIQIGTKIFEGQQIGEMGGSRLGQMDKYTSHLHYEMIVNGLPTNPAVNVEELVDPATLLQPINGGWLEEIVADVPKPKIRITL